jgi:light-regulated signal transduction histidine kinase (bacteriophytochrome)
VLDEKSLRYLKTISESAKRMGLLIDDLLTFSRIGRVEMRKTLFNLQAVVEEVLEDLRPEMKNCEITWRIWTLPDVYGDRSLIKLVFQNLIANAIKFTSSREQAIIEIGTTSGKDDETVIFVRDNGVGFDMKYVDKMFGVFQRLHAAGQFEGTGIGLANVQRIIHRHGGKTWAEGAVDKGATFYFSIPKSMKGE